ncbi:MAG: hypothetical protein AAGC93_11600 [Cyanobacteria bacterium P01_F01_bin.53]
MDDLPRDDLPQLEAAPAPQPMSDSVPHNESEPVASATSFQGLIHRLGSWIRGYKSLIQRIQSLDETTPVDLLTPKLVAWQEPLAAAGVTIAQREQQLKRVLKSYGKMIITRDGNDHRWK